MKTLERILPLLLAVIIQIMPLVRAVLPAAQGASSSWAIVLKIGAGLAALLGSYNAVSGATTSVAPINGSFTVQLTNGIPFKPYKMKTQGYHSASSWSANTAALGSSLYPIVPGMTLTNISGLRGWIGGTPTVVTNKVVTITAWENSGNSGAGVSADFTFNVVAPPPYPLVAVPPVSQVVFTNTSVQFQVACTGDQPLSYQWRRNGTNFTDTLNVLGATNSFVTLNAIALADAGYYDVIVTNNSGSVTSSAAILGVLASTPVRVTVSTWASIQSGPNFYSNIVESTVGYVKAKYDNRVAPTNTVSGGAKGYFQFDLAGLNPDPNFTTTFRVYQTSQSGKTHVQVWGMDQGFPGMTTNMTWATALGNDTNDGTALMLTGPYTATPLAEVLLANTTGAFDIVLPPGWGRFIQSNKVTLVLAAIPDAAYNSANGLRIVITNAATMPQLLITTNAETITQPQLTDLSLGAYGTVNFNFAGALNRSYTVEATTNMFDWVPLGPAIELVPYSGSYFFEDYQPTNYPQRFYRVQYP